MCRIRTAVLAIALVLLAAMTGAESPVPATSLAAGQTGRIHFQTTTVARPQFLIGSKDGPTSVIWGDLRLPARVLGRSPAVILVHRELASANGKSGGLRN